MGLWPLPTPQPPIQQEHQLQYKYHKKIEAEDPEEEDDSKKSIK